MGNTKSSEDFQQLKGNVSLMVSLDSDLEFVGKVSLLISLSQSLQDQLKSDDCRLLDVGASDLHSSFSSIWIRRQHEIEVLHLKGKNFRIFFRVSEASDFHSKVLRLCLCCILVEADDLVSHITFSYFAKALHLETRESFSLSQEVFDLILYELVIALKINVFCTAVVVVTDNVRLASGTSTLNHLINYRVT